ncbi:PREDICTED: uncharacterized protein LOC104822979 [Tarenaya hassleriana]|uniref:uncharacterized protein LOC104822979 n=1 Tax=Tarenaya hassleriana TaxID=28532 RepID=UPI00053C9F8C|nr:PREDICTED: uncharacterized protein LOC104822979 [Tarenaya hassleriana]
MQMVRVTAVVVVVLMAVTEAAGRPKADDPCSVTDFPVLCKSAVKNMKDPLSATAAAINALLPLTEKAKAEAQKGKSDGGFSICLSNYDSAIDNLNKSLKNIRENDGFSLNVNLSAALTNFETCNDAVDGSPAAKDIAKSAGVLRQMADNCLSLSTLLPQ